MENKLREPINSIAHFSGAAFFFLGTVFLLIVQILEGSTPSRIAGVAIFGSSVVLLYLASGIYHGYIGSDGVIRVLKKLDHSMIYVLIAGSYTPMCLQVLDGNKRVIILATIWAIVIVGIITKIFVRGIPRPVYTSFYLIMGWVVVFFIGDVYYGLPHLGFFLLAFGGILYSIGGVIYMVKKPNPSKALGFHELFHIFILAGSLSHYLMVFLYLR